ncbi:MAG: ComF family protein [Terracidiphilus sp.]
MDVLGCALLPAFCSLCGSPLPQLSSVPICAACWMEFPVLDGPVCARCGDTLSAPVLETDRSNPSQSNTALCRACRLAPPPFVRAVAFGAYEDRMKAAIHALKYDRLHPAARGLGRMLAEAIGKLAKEAPAEMLVVPVPLHPSKHAQRGFNQARLLAAYALGFLRSSHPEWRLTLASSTLMRLRATESQAGLTPRQRRLNVRGAFTVSDPAAVRLKHILVIDDIFTTGATARAAALALARAGTASVWVATLARAHRMNEFRSYQGAEDNQDLPGNAPIAEFARASIYSSQDQSSF